MIEIKKPTPALIFRNALVPLKRVEKIVLHHMAHKTAGIHDIHAFHRNRTFVNSSGKTAYWSGIGYNYWIAFDGTIYEARGLHEGAHTQGWNDKSIGIGFQGNFEEQKMTNEQLWAGVELCSKILNDYSLHKKDMVGHNELTATLCPGKYFRMKELKTQLLSSSENTVLYTVQVGTFKIRNNATNLKRQLVELGYKDAFIRVY